MSERTAAFLLVLVYLWTPLKGAERSVLCPLSSSCTLPCPFDPGPEVVIHWLHPPDDTVFAVHSFYHGSDQLGRQSPQYKGRTELFTDQIAGGNASLRIREIKVTDEGRYKCYTSTTKLSNEDFITVEVQAPVREVSLSEDGQNLTCVSEGLFPKPSVSWTPSSDALTTFKSSERGVWSVLSSVSLTHEYSCNVSTPHSWRSATYRRRDPVSVSGQSSVSCFDTNSTIKTLKWTFNGTQKILNKNGPELVYGPDWRTRVELGPGSELVLKNLNQNHQGLYSCSLTTDNHFYLISTEVTVKEQAAHTDVIVGVLVSVGLVLLIGAGVFLYKRHSQEEISAVQPRDHENICLNSPDQTAESNGGHT